MANRMYDLGRQKFLSGDLDWDAHTIKLALVRASVYTPNTVTDEFMSTVVAGGATVSRSAALASKTTTLGVADAADTLFAAVAAGAACDYIVVFRDAGGADSANPLIALFEIAVTPNGGDIPVVFDNGANKIFKL